MRSERVRYVLVPGWHGSEDEHWQSHWQRALPNASRVQQRDWVTPRHVDWVAELDREIRRQSGRVVGAHLASQRAGLDWLRTFCGEHLPDRSEERTALTHAPTRDDVPRIEAELQELPEFADARPDPALAAALAW